ncbi:MAG: YhcH/YjgK/YiaL family protein [Oscillospiraceae bacterium]|nr:YhcH/YjgK/YiaL family protein [Oscillospiraceae bacterium]
MIYTDINGLFEYYGISSHLDDAIELLQEKDFTALEEGRHEEDGDKLYINRFSYDTVPESEACFESHKHYIDVHVILEGEEKIGIADAAHYRHKEYDEETDSYVFSGTPEQYITLRPGKILIVFPRDAHMVKIMTDEKRTVDKAVIKVKIN